MNKPSDSKRTLTGSDLLAAGFEPVGQWQASQTGIKPDLRATSGPAVYAFVLDETVVCIGKASSCLVKRMNGYRWPGSSNSTNKRIKPLIQANLDSGRKVEILAAFPGNTEWLGLPVDLVPGLEAGLIAQFQPEWNELGKR